MVGYREVRRPVLQTSVLHRLEGAAGEAEERGAGGAFRDWAEAEGLAGAVAAKGDRCKAEQQLRA